MIYDPRDWYWTVDGDESRYWSSADVAYVETLPEGAGVTRIASEAELWDVLKAQFPAGMPLNRRPLSPWQFRAMLEIGGITETVQNAIASIPDPIQKAVAKARFDVSVYYSRNDPLISTLAPIVGMTDEQIDALWSQAAQLQA